MRMTMPDAVKDKVYKWAGVHDLLHFWERDETYFIIIKANNGIYFLRLFSLGGEYVPSQDSMYTL